MSIKTADVVIVGGGVTGVATAYFLGQAGIRSIVIERDSLASHASGFAYGGLSPLGGAGIPGPMYCIARHSFKLHLELAETLPQESGIDFEFRKRQSLSLVFTDEEASRIKDDLKWQARQPGFTAEWVDAESLQLIDDRISRKALGGSLVDGMAEVEPYKFVLALAQTAEKLGAIVRHGSVTGLKTQGGRVSGVTMESGEVSCDSVVLSMGPWAGICSDWLGIPVPVSPLKGQIVRMNAPGPPLDCSIGWAHNYATTKPDGLLWAGTTEEQAGFDESPTIEGRDEIMSAVIKTLPYMEDAQLVQQTACLRPLSTDGILLLGPASGWENVYIATGAGRKGILYGPALGEVMSGLISGESLDLDISPYNVARFLS